MVCTRRDHPGGEESPRGPCWVTMSRREWRNAVLFVEKLGPVLCHLRAPIVPKLGTHSYGQNLISIELNPYVIRGQVRRPRRCRYHGLAQEAILCLERTIVRTRPRATYIAHGEFRFTQTRYRTTRRVVAFSRQLNTGSLGENRKAVIVRK